MGFFFYMKNTFGKFCKTLFINLVMISSLLSSSRVNAERKAQTVTISAENESLEKVCRQIEKQTGYYFVYAKDMRSESIRITINLDHVEIENALRTLFKDLPVTYQIISKVVVVNTLKKNKIQGNSFISNEERFVDINGVVFTEQGQPLAGASVAVKSNGRVTLTNVKGEFILKNVPSGSVLIISYIGYGTKQLRAEESEKMIVKLSIATDVLDGMIIKGYYNTTNRLNTGNVSIVKGEDIAKQPVTDPLLALEGRVPGLYIQQTSGVPGAYSTFHLRGVNSMPSVGKLATLNDPLFIVDGVPLSSQTLTNPFAGGGIVGLPSVSGKTGEVDYNSGQGLSPFNSITPSDIESIEVLKDADATAIYGSRGGNGVIVITTKKGKAGPTKVDLNMFSGIGKITRTLDLMNTQQYLQMRREGFKNDGTKPGSTDYDVNGFWDTTRYTNWQKLLINNSASFYNAQMNVSGGNNNLQFSLGGGYSDQKTTMPGNYGDKRISFHVSLGNTSIDQRFHTQFTAAYSNDRSNLPAYNLASVITLAPDAPPLYDAYGALNWQVYGTSASWDNPLAQINTNVKAVTDYLNTSLSMSYQIITGLDIKANFGYSKTQQNQVITIPATAYGPPLSTLYGPLLRSAQFGSANSKTWIAEPQLTYRLGIGKGKFDALIGATFQNSTSHADNISASGFASDALMNTPLLATSKNISGYTSNENRYEAVFGRLGYNWKEKYILNFTARRDGSSRFGPGKQFGSFGAIGAAWIFTREDAVKNIFPFLSFGKLRISYGTSGNNNIADYQFMSTYSVSASQYQGSPVFNPTRMANPYFSWETVRKLEGGLELGLLNDRIFFTISYYRNRSNNQLVGYTLPALTGFTSVQANLPALIQNTGIEVTLNTTNIRTKNWTWTSSFNVSSPRNKLISYQGFERSPYTKVFSIGRSLFIRNLYHYTGVDPQTGLYKFSSKTGVGNPFSSNPDDRRFTQPITQTLFGGLLNTIRYKGIQLDIFIQFVKQVNINYWSNFSKPAGAFNVNLPTYLLDQRWKTPGDKANMQRFTNNNGFVQNTYTRFTSSDGVISDASFIRLKNLSLSYELAQSGLKRKYLQNMRVYIQCQNLFTLTHFMGLDPETGSLLPPIRMITGGFQLGF